MNDMICRCICRFRLNSRLFSSVYKLHQKQQLVRFGSHFNIDMDLDSIKQLAAQKAIDDNLSNNRVIGVGSGSTIVFAVKRLAEIVIRDKLDVVCVPTSFQAKQLIKEYKLRLSDLEENPSLDVAFDGADEVDSSLTLIKGGGGCLTQEKIIASVASKLIIIADYTKKSETLGTNWTKGVPIEVIPMSHVVVKRKIEDLFGGLAELRMAKAKAGPLVTDNGNFIIDWKFDLSETKDWKDINVRIKMIAGVVETGLFVGMTHKCYFGNKDGTVSVVP